MDYFAWSQEYYRDAENLLSTIEKYKNLLKTADRLNYEQLNSTLSSYRYIYYDLVNTARTLEERAKESLNAA